jgi:hypothetical protein
MCEAESLAYHAPLELDAREAAPYEKMGSDVRTLKVTSEQVFR